MKIRTHMAAAAAADENATYVPATIVTVAIASGSTDLRSSASPLQNILTPSPERFAIGSFNQHPERSGHRAIGGAERRYTELGLCAAGTAQKLRSFFPPWAEGRVPSAVVACATGPMCARPASHMW